MPKKKRFTLTQKQQSMLAAYLFIAPNFLCVFFFLLIPILFAGGISFFSWNYAQGFGSWQFVGLDNFIKMWSDRWFLDSLVNTFVFSFSVVPTTVILAIVGAELIDKFCYGKKAIRLAAFLPYISNVVAISAVWAMMYSDYGPVNALLRGLGVKSPPAWLADYNWALPAVVIVTVWINLGYNILIYSGGIQAIPKDYYEASQIDGANRVQQFLFITVPCLRPTTFFLVITNLISTFQVFGQIMVMTKGGPGTSTHVLSYYIYTTAFNFYDMGYAAAISWVLFAIILAITLIQWKGQKKYDL